MTKAYRIPKLGEEPSDAMRDWLATCPQQWDGDDSGINLSLPDGREMVGGPGDWVVCLDCGLWVVVPDAALVDEAERSDRERAKLRLEALGMRTNLQHYGQEVRGIVMDFSKYGKTLSDIRRWAFS